MLKSETDTCRMAILRQLTLSSHSGQLEAFTSELSNQSALTSSLFGRHKCTGPMLTLFA